MKFYLFLCVSLTLAYQGFSAAVEKITESTLKPTENPVKLNAESSSTSTELTPESASMKCPENMGPGLWDHEDTWKCWCKEPFFPSAMNNTCVEMFRQGPCNPGYLVVPRSKNDNSTNDPRCVPNHCVEDGLIFFYGTCVNISASNPCEIGPPIYKEGISAFGCMSTSAPASVITVPYRVCPPNSRKDKYGICRPKL